MAKRKKVKVDKNPYLTAKVALAEKLNALAPEVWTTDDPMLCEVTYFFALTKAEYDIIRSMLHRDVFGG